MESLLNPFSFFATNYLVTLLIAVLCAYLGVFVVLRRIVFVGVAVGEAAACGVAFAFDLTPFVAGLGAGAAWKHSGPLGCAVLFSLGTISLFSLRHEERRTSREGLIGLGYALAAGLALLLVWKSAVGLEKLKNILSGSVLFVGGVQFEVIAACCLVLGLLHIVFFRRFLFVSFDPEMASTLGLRTGLWDFLLYFSLGIALSISLYSAGLLLVFSFLIIPPLCALQLADRMRGVIIIAILCAITASAAGLSVTQRLDLPMGPTISVILGALFFLSLVARRLPAARAALIALLAIACALSLGLAVYSLDRHIEKLRARPAPPPAAPAMPGNDDVDRQLDAIDRAGRDGETDIAAIASHLEARADDVREASIASLARIGDHRAILALEAHADREAEPGLQLQLAKALVRLGSKRGVTLLLALLGSDAMPFFRSEALAHLEKISAEKWGYDVERSATENAAALERARRWWRRHQDHIRWDPKEKTFRVPK